MTVLPTIRHQLLQAAQRNAAAGVHGGSSLHLNWRVPRRLALATSHLATAALIAVTVAVAAGAILLLGHGRHAQVAAGSSVANSRGDLLQTLAVLRASPSATDQRAAACVERTINKYGIFKCYRDIPDYSGTLVWVTEHPSPVALSAVASMGHPKWDLTLIRVIPLGSGKSVMLYAGSWRGTFKRADVSSAPTGKRNWGVLAVFAASRKQIAMSLPTTVGSLRANGLGLYPPSVKPPLVVMIVPDGVARVTIGAVRLGRQHWLENVSAPVRDNIAMLTLSTPNSHYTGFLQSAVAQVTWSNAAGDVIKHTRTALQWGG